MAETKIPEKTQTFRVRAMGLGPEKFAWYGLQPAGHRQIKNGDIFDCWVEDFKPRWMERLDDKTTVVAVPAQEHAATVKELEEAKAKIAAIESAKKPADAPLAPAISPEAHSHQAKAGKK